MPSGGGGGSTNTIQKADPWKEQQPFLLRGFEEAERLYGTPGPNVFPQSTTVPFSPQSEMALGLTEQRALQGSPLNMNAQGMINDTMQGDYLGGNPYLDDVYDRAAGAVTRNFSEGVLPNIDSTWSGKGRYGSDLWANQKDQAFDQLGRSLEGMGSQMYGQDYANERGRQMQAAGMAPGMAAQDYMDFQQLGNVGGIVESKAGDTLADQMRRYEYYQNLPEQKLQNFMQNIQGNYGSQTSTSSTQSANPLSTGLGLGLTGMGLLGGGLPAGAAVGSVPWGASQALGPASMASWAPAAAGAGAAAGGMIGASSLPFFMCHVAQEVYGMDNPDWIKFYFWKEKEAPESFRNFYNQNSEQIAEIIHDKPDVKAEIRTMMDELIS